MMESIVVVQCTVHCTVYREQVIKIIKNCIKSTKRPFTTSTDQFNHMIKFVCLLGAKCDFSSMIALLLSSRRALLRMLTLQGFSLKVHCTVPYLKP